MKRSCLIAGTVMLALASPALAQSPLHITPMVGAFHPATDAYDLSEAAQQGRLIKGNALALGVALEYSILRATVQYATGATITGDGTTVEGDIGDGSLLALTGGVILRPLPQLILVQPYLTGGVGFKREQYSFNEQGFGNVLPDDESTMGLHLGVGANLMLGGLGLMAEVSDVISAGDDELFGRHDMFVMAGLRLRL